MLWTPTFSVDTTTTNNNWGKQGEDSSSLVVLSQDLSIYEKTFVLRGSLPGDIPNTGPGGQLVQVLSWDRYQEKWVQIALAKNIEARNTAFEMWRSWNNHDHLATRKKLYKLKTNDFSWTCQRIEITEQTPTLKSWETGKYEEPELGSL